MARVEDATSTNASSDTNVSISSEKQGTDVNARKKLMLHSIDITERDIRPAPARRLWMDETPGRFAYRCLPLVVAGTYGWQILCPWSFNCMWTGQLGTNAIVTIPDPGRPSPGHAHFGGPIMTFPIPGVFRTETGYDLMVQGPINLPKDGIHGLTAIIETDWMPFTWSMNWIFTRPGVTVRFERGEPICQIFPIRKADIEAFDPIIQPMCDDPDVKASFESWQRSRDEFHQQQSIPGSDAQRAQWQRFYQNGTNERGEPVSTNHRTKIMTPPFRVE